MSAGDSQDRWLERQLALRIDEVDAAVRASEAAVSASRLQKRTTILQVIAVMAGLLASGAAAFAAYQAGRAVRVAEQGTEQQSADNQLSSAIAAIGGSTPAERVAGMTLLDLNVHARISAATNELARQDAFGEYSTAIDVLANYVREADIPVSGPTVASAHDIFGPGYGYPHAGLEVPFDVLYAAAEIRDLLSLQNQVADLRFRPLKSIGLDLTGDELFGLSWAKIKFNWLDAYMPGIDLRAANLVHSSFAGSYLAGAFLQCANLSGADLAGANLSHADLRGANVSGANFTDATLAHANLTGVFGDASGLPPGLPEKSWNPDRQPCYSSPLYWDYPAANAPLP